MTSFMCLFFMVFLILLDKDVDLVEVGSNNDKYVVVVDCGCLLSQNFYFGGECLARQNDIGKEC